MNTTTTGPTIGDVLSGKEAMKFEFSVDTKTIFILGAVILVSVIGGIFIGNLLKN